MEDWLGVLFSSVCYTIMHTTLWKLMLTHMSDNGAGTILIPVKVTSTIIDI